MIRCSRRLIGSHDDACPLGVYAGLRRLEHADEGFLLFCRAAVARVRTTQRLRDWASRPSVPLSAMIVFYAAAAFAAVAAITGNQDSIGYLATRS
jgi:hypothetical protein